MLARNLENLGLSKSLNKAFKMAKGEHIARQDADDVSLPKRLATQVAFLEKESSIVLLGTAIEWIDQSAAPTGQIACHPSTDAAIRWRMLLHNSFYHSSVMVRRSALANSELWYDSEMQYAQDYDLWSRLLVHGQGGNLALPLVQLRSHKDQITRVASQPQHAIADEIALANFGRAGLASRFSREEITLLRRIGHQGTSVEGEALVTQLRSLLKLLRYTGNGDGSANPEREAVKKEKFRQLRFDLTHPPRDLAMFRAQLLMVKADPFGVTADIARSVPLLARSALGRWRDSGNI